MEESAWELSKENIQPLKQGRQPKILTKALRCSSANIPVCNENSVDGSTNSSATLRALILQQEKQEFEESLRDCMTTPDPLAVYYRYIRWMEETHPSGKDKELRELVNACLKALKDETWVEKYANDLRWLYIWLKFASFSRTMGSLAVYDHMLKVGHCTQLAGFYLQWAGELETAGHFDEAAKIFQIGIQNTAEPLHSLVSAYEEFQIRCARRLALERAKCEQDDDDATRNVLGVLKAVGTQRGVATAPYARQSNAEAVRCGAAVPSKSQQSDAFTVFEESKENSTRFQPSDAKKKLRVSEIPSESTVCKENIVSADVWTKGKLKQTKKSTSSSQQGNFEIYVDDPAPVPNHEPERKSKALIKSTNSSVMPDGSKFACCVDKIYDGGNETSVEELRAARWRKSNATVSTQGCPVGRRALNAIKDELPSQQASAVKAEAARGLKANGSPPESTSFTENIYREVMAAFSNTVHFNNIGSSADTENINPPSSALTSKNQGKPVGSGCFAIYEDLSTEREQNDLEGITKEEADKENIDPKRNSNEANERKRRNIAGILCESAEFVYADDKNDVILVDEADEDEAAAANPLTIAIGESLAKNYTTFDFNETTVAGLHRLLPSTAGRAISTPCHSSRIQPLSMSIHKPYDNLESDTEYKNLVAVVEPARSNDVCDGQTVEGIPTAKSPGTGQKLSTITETSREYRSSSSSGNSMATGSSANTRRQLLSCASGIGALPSISEGAVRRTVLTFATPHSEGPSGTKSSGDAHRVSATGTPYYEREPGKSGVEKPCAARKLLLTGDNEDLVEDSGRIEPWLPLASQSINPWTPDFVTYQLATMPRRLESYTNFHTFDEELPQIIIGRSVCLGGETFDVVTMAGEGAYAKVFKCRFEHDGGNEVVLKLQKPCCPLEFYICQELRHRLKAQSLLSAVEPGLTLFTDAYMFTNGSVLVTDYCPYGTLVDLVNIYKQISSERSLPEMIVAYLTADILRILDAAHGQQIIHGDLKPDNFLVLDTPPLDISKSWSQVRTVRLIDWGRSVDMALLSPSTTFSGNCGTSAFACCEMQAGRPWTYQADYYGILGTVHVLAFGEYMTTHKVGKTNTWRINRAFKRRWDDRIWRDFFDVFLNVPDCWSLPSLTEWRKKFEDFVHELHSTRPTVWTSEIRKMHDVLLELQTAKAKRIN